MKKIIIAAATLLCITGCKDDMRFTKTISIANNHATTDMPSLLLTAAGESWKVSPAESSCYISADKVSYKVTDKTKGHLCSLKFKETGEALFVYTLEDGAAVQVQGQVSFAKRSGKNIFVIHPLKGIKISGKISTAISDQYLQENYAGSFLWEKISFKELVSEDFLLLVDMNEHPLAATAKPGHIDRSWVSKFYARK